MEMIQAAVEDGLGVVIAPIAFVSEHVETLVELDHDYARRAAALGCTTYIRAPALGLQAAFIRGLAELVSRALLQTDGIHSGSDFACAANWAKCPIRQREGAR
jgi:ferrochelatase